MLNHERLQERLRQDLGRVQPGGVPLDALITRGRQIKTRRRATVLAGLAAVAVLAVGAPVVLSAGGGSSRSPAAGHATVLASGTIDGRQWTFVTGPQDPGPDGCPDIVTGYWGATGSELCVVPMPTATDPVLLSSSDTVGAVSMFVAQLRPDVDHITVTGTDGTVLTPAVALLSGRRFAFFALPPEQGIGRLDAVASDGKPIAYTLPYREQNNPPSLIESWYPAGTTPTQPPVKQTLFSDPTSSPPVTVSLDMGPFGVCYLLSAPQGADGRVGPYPDCHSVTPPALNALSLRTYFYGDRELLLAEVNSAVDHVDVTLFDASTVRLTHIRVGGHSFVVTLLDPGVTYRSANAFDASGGRLATETR